MAQDYDVALKLLFRSKSSRAVKEIAGGAVKRWLDKELPTIRNTRVDLLGETIGGEYEGAARAKRTCYVGNLNVFSGSSRNG